MSLGAPPPPLYIIIFEPANSLIGIKNITTAFVCVADMFRRCSIVSELGMVGLTAETELIVVSCSGKRAAKTARGRDFRKISWESNVDGP